MNEEEMYLCSFDQKKAFDSMSHTYLFALLEHLDINPFLINSVKRIYTQSFAYIVANGSISKDKILVKSSIKQGCAMSMFLYSGGIEELAVNIHNNIEIIGYRIPRMSTNNIYPVIKMTMYADDVASAAKTLKNIDLVVKEFKKWGKVSGASLNEDKTKILAINSPHKEYDGNKFVDKVKILGITFNKYGIDKENLEMCLKKINISLNLWRSVRLDMLERITVLRTFALSKLWYLCNFISLNEDEIKKLETLCFKYIWNGQDQIKRSILYSEFKDGGLNMVSIRTKLDMIRIRNLVYLKKNLKRPQYQFSVYWLKFIFRNYLENFNICPTGLDNQRPIIYSETIKSFKKFSVCFKVWCEIENQKRKIICEKKNKEYKPLDENFLNNSNILESKFIYNLFVKEVNFSPKIPLDISLKEQEIIYSNIHSINKSSRLRLVNFKLMHNSLATDKRFKNKYIKKKKCYLCNKELDESIEHLFYNCHMTKTFFKYIKDKYLKDKTLVLSLELLKFKYKIESEDYKVLSTFVYSIWRIRNMCKYEQNFDSQMVFKILFEKWMINTMTWEVV